METVLGDALRGVGDQKQKHVEGGEISLQWRRPMTAAEGDPLELTRRARKLGLVLP